MRRTGDFVYTGAQILDPEGVWQVPDKVFSLNLLWDLYNRAGGLRACVYPGRWCDVGSPEGLASARQAREQAADV